MLFPLFDGECQVNGQTFIRFHKHLEVAWLDGIEGEIAKVEELIY